MCLSPQITDDALLDRIGEEDMRAIFRLVLIALVILPILPNQNYGPYDVLNPFHVWLMVVLIVGEYRHTPLVAGLRGNDAQAPRSRGAGRPRYSRRRPVY